MERIRQQDLQQWFTDKSRKPLIIRGARQVGKTWLARRLAKQNNLNLIEVNFEQNPNYANCFISNDPKQIISSLSATLEKNITISNSLLFLDEIQAAPTILATLRWFLEQMPELPVIAAGSLLDFMLQDYEYSMPVGRVSYLYLEPMSFIEFLLATNHPELVNFLNNYNLNSNIPQILHDKLLGLFKIYTFVGGMPAAVFAWCNTGSWDKISETQQSLLTTYRDDFAKYGSRISQNILEDVFIAIPTTLSNKFKYSMVNNTAQSSSIKHALNLLCLGRVCHKVQGVTASGLPLASGVNAKYFKTIFLDLGLVSALLKLSLHQSHQYSNLDLNNSGGLMEQAVGQLLRTTNPYYIDPALYCWAREQAGSAAEIDYILQHGSNIVPIEVKAGSTGSLKSLHIFMAAKKLSQAVRINSDYPSCVTVHAKLFDGTPVEYNLLSLPVYLTEYIHKII